MKIKYPTLKKKVDTIKADITNKIVSDITARDAIPTSQRKIGMEVKVLSDNKKYELVGGTTNTNWKEVSTGVETSTVTNLCLNSDFAAGKTSWETMANTAEERVTIASDEFLGAYKAVLYSTAGSRAGITQNIAGVPQGNTIYVSMWVKPTRKETDNFPRILINTGAGTLITRLIDDAIWTGLPLNEWTHLSAYVTCPSNGIQLAIGRGTEQVWTMEVTGIIVTDITQGFGAKASEITISDFNNLLGAKFEKKYFKTSAVITTEDYMLLRLSDKIESGVSVGTSKAITNRCLNSNFANGKSDWTSMEYSVDANVTVVSNGGIVGNSMSLAATGVNPTGIVQNVSGALNDIFFVAMWVKPTRKETGGYPRVNINNIVGDAILGRLCEDAEWDAMTLNEWTYVYTFVTSPADGISLNIGRKTGQLYTMEVSAIVVINLTQDLGSKAIGLRATDMKYMLEKYSGRHFSGEGTLTTDDFATATLAKLNAYLDIQTT